MCMSVYLGEGMCVCVFVCMCLWIFEFVCVCNCVIFVCVFIFFYSIKFLFIFFLKCVQIWFVCVNLWKTKKKKKKNEQKRKNNNTLKLLLVECPSWKGVFQTRAFFRRDKRLFRVWPADIIIYIDNVEWQSSSYRWFIIERDNKIVFVSLLRDTVIEFSVDTVSFFLFATLWKQITDMIGDRCTKADIAKAGFHKKNEKKLNAKASLCVLSALIHV